MACPHNEGGAVFDRKTQVQRHGVVVQVTR
jgi:hypothetical protein